MSSRPRPAVTVPDVLALTDQPRAVLEQVAAQLWDMIHAADAAGAAGEWPDERTRPRRRHLEAQLAHVEQALEALPE